MIVYIQWFIIALVLWKYGDLQNQNVKLTKAVQRSVNLLDKYHKRIDEDKEMIEKLIIMSEAIMKNSRPANFNEIDAEDAEKMARGGTD